MVACTDSARRVPPPGLAPQAVAAFAAEMAQGRLACGLPCRCESRRSSRRSSPGSSGARVGTPHTGSQVSRREDLHLASPSEKPRDQRGTNRGVQLHVQLTVAPPLSQLRRMNAALRSERGTFAVESQLDVLRFALPRAESPLQQRASGEWRTCREKCP